MTNQTQGAGRRAYAVTTLRDYTDHYHGAVGRMNAQQAIERAQRNERGLALWAERYEAQDAVNEAYVRHLRLRGAI